MVLFRRSDYCLLCSFQSTQGDSAGLSNWTQQSSKLEGDTWERTTPVMQGAPHVTPLPVHHAKLCASVVNYYYSLPDHFFLSPGDVFRKSLGSDPEALIPPGPPPSQFVCMMPLSATTSASVMGRSRSYCLAVQILLFWTCSGNGAQLLFILDDGVQLYTWKKEIHGV
ncbi:hypothetical protein M758_5G063600 [Ceratodon purpureus]|nr:hypothetical protein M758_5G063600 [Ceratodon purpureus]